MPDIARHGKGPPKGDVGGIALADETRATQFLSDALQRRLNGGMPMLPGRARTRRSPGGASSRKSFPLRRFETAVGFAPGNGAYSTSKDARNPVTQPFRDRPCAAALPWR